MIYVSSQTSAAELQSIINNAAAGETISLGAGTFNFDRMVVIDRDDIAVVGTGSDSTKIALSGSALSTGAFQIGGVIDKPVYSGSFNLAQSALEGAAKLVLKDTGGLKAGDHLCIERPNTSEYLNSIGDSEWREDKPLRTSMVEIASIDGDVVTLRNGLAFDFTASDAVVSRIEVAQNVRLGGFSIDSGLAASDPSEFANSSSSFNRDNAVSVSGASAVKLFDIAVREAPSNGFTFAQTIFLEATNLSVDGAHNKGDGGNGYGFQLRALYDSNLSGLEALDTRHAVVFASWTSEANNVVGVRNTNRDINLHGGPDHGNLISVANSIRTEAEADYMSPTLFVNTEGTDYGAPTDAAANEVVFKTVYGTNKAETLIANNSGAEFFTRAGADTLIGGAGDDKLNAGKGDDYIYGSGGNDDIDGGMGKGDRLYYAGEKSDYIVTKDSIGRFVIHKESGGYDIVTGVESFRFGGESYSASSLNTTRKTWFGSDSADQITVTGGSDIVLSGDGYDRVYSQYSFTLGDETEALALTGSAAVDGTGTDRANTLAGNDAANTLLGLGGNDRIFARGGNDYVSGGEGNDELYGQAGNDRINGGAGIDQLFGNGGSDIFVFSAGHDDVRDFSKRGGDRVDIGATAFATASEFFAAFKQAANTSGDTFDSLGIDVAQVGSGSGFYVDIRAEADDGSMLSMSLYGTPLQQLLANGDWIA